MIRKPPGITSSALVGKVKKQIGGRKVGHTGTLDRFAEGLMILPVGKATSFSDYFLGMGKTYLAELELGVETDSGDPEGQWIQRLSSEKITEVWEKDWDQGKVLYAEIEKIRHWTSQEAPVISALKQNGKRQSDLFRSGLAVTPKRRPISVDFLEILEFKKESVIFRVSVSSGTYIRKFAIDLGKILGFPISLRRLVRESIGKWSLDQAKSIETVEAGDLLPIRDCVPLPEIEIKTDWEVKSVSHGRKLSLDLSGISDSQRFYLLTQNGKILAYCQKDRDQEYHYIRVF